MHKIIDINWCIRLGDEDLRPDGIMNGTTD